VKHTIETLPTLGDSAPSDPESVAEAQLKRWSELLELLRSKGFGVESLPESDHRLNLTVDMTSGRSLSSVDALHEFATPSEKLARELSAALAKAFTEPAAALARQINEAVLQKDLASAVAAVKDAKEKGTFAFPLSSELLQAMCAIEVSGLSPEDRSSLLEIRAAVASQLKSWKVTGDDADALLAEFKQSMTSEQIADFAWPLLPALWIEVTKSLGSWSSENCSVRKAKYPQRSAVGVGETFLWSLHRTMQMLETPHVSRRTHSCRLGTKKRPRGAWFGSLTA
jgi:hypothetical protein